MLDSAAETFEADVTKLARSIAAPLYAVSCIGIGKGSASWSEEDMTKLEVGVVGAFARGCFAAGVERYGDYAPNVLQLVALCEIVEIDPTVCELGSMPAGHNARRERVGAPWVVTRE